MIACSLALALTAQLAAPPPLTMATMPVSPDAPVHLGIALRLTHVAELEALKTAQQDPRSPEFRRWLSPAEFGARFGQPAPVYAELSSWLTSGGLAVTLFPNRLFIEATGTARQVQSLLGVGFAPVEGEGPSVRVPVGPVKLPKAFAPLVLHIAGLDTRVRTRHHLRIGTNANTLGPQDLRAHYNLNPLLARGFVGQGQRLVVLSTALPPNADISKEAIDYFYKSISDARITFSKRVLPNPQQDFDTQQGGAGEFELDLEMQSIGSPGAESITLEVPPASEVFTTGVNDIVNNLPSTTAVSISLGMCEPNAQALARQTGFDEPAAMRQGITQGVMQGQTWFAASGDNGANDCRNGVVAADYPSSIPEMIAMGGTMIAAVPWNGNKAITAYAQEVTWNGGNNGGAGGGGTSILFPLPTYQSAAGLTGTGRNVPDLSLISGTPGVAVSSAVPPGRLEPAQGTSVASPLAAGFFGLLASHLGCRLGDVHPVIYALGVTQADGGTEVFHDITSGNLNQGGVAGPVAGHGYDMATGWGSLDVAAFAAALPGCPVFQPDAGQPGDGGLAADGGAEVDAGLTGDAGSPAPLDAGSPLPPYDQCAFIGCAPSACLTLPDGPSGCTPRCDPKVASSCPAASVCSQDTVFSTSTLGSCVPGCQASADCASQPGTVCSLCAQVCLPTGSPTAHLGAECTADADCPTGAYCATGFVFRGGYCTQDCQLSAAAGSACSCPSGSQCGRLGRGQGLQVCLGVCGTAGQECGRDNYLCQRQDVGDPVCLPKCRILNFGGSPFDTCEILGTSETCDEASGVCGGPAPPVVVDAGVPDAGAGATTAVEAVSGTLGPTFGGCGCSSPAGAPALFAVLALVAARRRRVRR